MMSTPSLSGLLLLLLATAAPSVRAATAPITPHIGWGSSIGVLGCKIDVNRAAFWPQPVDCDKLCVKVTEKGGKSLHLLRIDQSQPAPPKPAAHDISADAFRFLTGLDSTGGPAGFVDMEWEDADFKNCEPILKGGNLPIAAANSMTFYSNCVRTAPASPVAKADLWDIQDAQCKWGTDRKCKPPNIAAGENTADCGGQSNPQNELNLPVNEITTRDNKPVAFRA